MSSKRKSHTLGLYVSRNQGIFLFMPNCYEMEILSKSWLFVMIWQMDISQGSVLVSVFCLTRCNYKQCCLFAHLASGYHVRPGLSSPHVIRCPMSHLTRGAGIIEMEFCVKWEYDPGLQWPQSGCLGFESLWSWCGQYDNTRHGHSITRRYQSEQRSHAQCQASYSYSHSRPIASHHQVIHNVLGLL